MALTLGDNFSYLGAKPLDGRVKYDTIADMVAMSASTLYDGIIAFCVADGKNYQWKSTNEVDATLGKWRELATGGGGETYSDFTGATSSTAGAHGLVPAPSAGDEGKVLFGNGLWGALPSVDLSVLSNEAFQFSPTEKPVGTWTDSNNVTKLLYAKTIFIQSGALSAGQTNAIPHGVSNIDKKMLLTGALRYGTSTKDLQMPFSDDYKPITNSILCISSITDTDINISVGSDYVSSVTIASGFVAILYTKTTDSPLPSDVKFAGVWYDGSVVLEKTVDLGSDVNITPTGWYTSSISNSGISKITYAFSVSSTGTYTPLMGAVNNGDYIIFKACRGDGNAASARYITYRYTLAS